MGLHGRFDVHLLLANMPMECEDPLGGKKYEVAAFCNF